MQSPMNSVPADPAGEATPIEVANAEVQASPGIQLATARAEKGLSLEDVAQRMKYSPRQISALEQDDYSKLSGTTFVRGMIRSYAKLLDMDPAPLLSELERREVPAQATVDLRTKRVPFPQDAPRSNRLYLVLSVIFVIAAFAVVIEWQSGISWWRLPFLDRFYSASPAPTAPAVVAPALPPLDGSPSDPVIAPASDSAVPTTTGVSVAPSASATVKATENRKESGVESSSLVANSIPSTAVPVNSSGSAGNRGSVGVASASAMIILQFQRDSWVQVRQTDGKILLSQMNRGGSEQQLDGRPPFDVVIGNAPGVRLVYKGQPFDLRPHYKVDVARLVLE